MVQFTVNHMSIRKTLRFIWSECFSGVEAQAQTQTSSREVKNVDKGTALEEVNGIMKQSWCRWAVSAKQQLKLGAIVDKNQCSWGHMGQCFIYVTAQKLSYVQTNHSTNQRPVTTGDPWVFIKKDNSLNFKEKWVSDRHQKDPGTNKFWLWGDVETEQTATFSISAQLWCHTEAARPVWALVSQDYIYPVNKGLC